MKFYGIIGEDEHEFSNSVSDVAREIFRGFDGTSLKQNWTPVSVEIVTEENGATYRKSDFHSTGGLPLIMRNTAVTALEEFWQLNGEILPLAEISGQELYVFNAQMIDALDLQQSKFVRFPSSGRIMAITEHVFLEDKLWGVDVFHLPESPHIQFFSQNFVDAAKAAGLRGIEFIEKWDSEEDRRADGR